MVVIHIILMILLFVNYYNDKHNYNINISEMMNLDINDPKVAKLLIESFKDIARKVFREEIVKLNLEKIGKVAVTGSGATIQIYIENSTTAVEIKNPRNFSLTEGQLIVIVFPNFKNDDGKYIDRIL